METEQLTQMVNWLDEELRRERAELAKTQGVVDRQTSELAEQARQTKELEGRLASTQAQLSRLAQVDDTLAQFKSEIVLMLEKQQEQFRRDLREAEQVRMIEREAQTKAVNELRKDLQPLPRLQEAIKMREAEDRRLGEAVLSLRQDVTNVGKDIDERTRNVGYLVEQRAYDNKRLAALQEESLTLLKRTEGMESKFPPLEDRGQRHERHIQELLQFRTDIKREQAEWMESQRVAEEQRKRVIAEWREQVEAHRADVKDIQARAQTYTEMVQAGQRTLAGVETFKEQVRRDLNQVSELQRLAEERQRKEMAEWQAEDEKRWKKHEMQWEHHWKEQYGRYNQLVSRLAAADEEVRTLGQLLSGLWRLQEVRNTFQLGEAQRWQSEFDKATAERDQLLRKSAKKTE